MVNAGAIVCTSLIKVSIIRIPHHTLLNALVWMLINSDTKEKTLNLVAVFNSLFQKVKAQILKYVTLYV